MSVLTDVFFARMCQVYEKKRISLCLLSPLNNHYSPFLPHGAFLRLWEMLWEWPQHPDGCQTNACIKIKMVIQFSRPSSRMWQWAHYHSWWNFGHDREGRDSRWLLDSHLLIAVTMLSGVVLLLLLTGKLGQIISWKLLIIKSNCFPT